MDRFFDIISKWDHFGQGIFFICVLMAIYEIAKLFVVIFRGWPPIYCEEQDDEET